MIQLLPILAVGFLAQGDARTELAQLAAKAAKAESYTFQVSTREEGGFGRGGDADAAQLPLTGHYRKDQPLHLRHGEQQAFRQGEHLVYLAAEGEWKPFDRSELRGAWRRGGPGGGAGQGGAQEAERNRMFGLLTLLRAPTPHAFLASMGDGVGEVEKETREDGKVVFRGKLTSEAAERLAGGGFRMGRRGGGMAEFDYSGSFQLLATGEGLMHEIEVTTRMSGSFGEREIERKRHHAMTISAVGETAFEVPEAAQQALAQAAEGGGDKYDEEF